MDSSIFLLLVICGLWVCVCISSSPFQVPGSNWRTDRSSKGRLSLWGNGMSLYVQMFAIIEFRTEFCSCLRTGSRSVVGNFFSKNWSVRAWCLGLSCGARIPFWHSEPGSGPTYPSLHSWQSLWMIREQQPAQPLNCSKALKALSGGPWTAAT